MKIEIEINLDNDAFVEPVEEIVRMLHDSLIRKSDIIYFGGSRPLIDINGNKVGLITILI
jgi:hypothetical protein